MFGREPKCPLDLIIRKPDIQLPTSNEEFIINLKDNMQRAFEISKTNTQIKVDLSKINYDRKAYACMFKPGDKCWIRDFKPKPGLCNKFCSKYKGPYVVEQRFDNLVYKCKPLREKGRHVTVHRNNMKAYTPRNVVGIPSEVKPTKEDDKIKKTKKPTKVIMNKKAKETLIEQATNKRDHQTKAPKTSYQATKTTVQRSVKEKNKLSKPIIQQQKTSAQQQQTRGRGRPKKIRNNNLMPKIPTSSADLQRATRVQKACKIQTENSLS